MKRILVGLIVILPCVVYSSDDASFLIVTPNGRAAGLSSAFVAISDDIYASYYNDAGLGFQNGLSFGGTGGWCPYPLIFGGGERYDFWGVSFPLTIIGGRIGISAIYNHKDGGTDISHKLSYGRRIGKDLSIGFGARLLSISPMLPMWDIRMDNYYSAVDISMLYRKENLSIGCAIQNIGPSITYSYTLFEDTTFEGRFEAPLPSLLRMGLGYKSPNLGDYSILGTADIVRNFTESINDENFFYFSFGIEYSYKDFLFLRGGCLLDINKNTERTGFSYGIGIKLEEGFYIDLGVEPEYPLQTNRVKLSFRGQYPPNSWTHTKR